LFIVAPLAGAVLASRVYTGLRPSSRSGLPAYRFTGLAIRRGDSCRPDGDVSLH
jgi:hypothetical protein